MKFLLLQAGMAFLFQFAMADFAQATGNQRAKLIKAQKVGINGTVRDDVMKGVDGNDHMNALRGDDLLLGGKGDDSLSGGDGHDYLEGDEGKDVLTGGLGNDAIYGGLGPDRLQGGAGNDLFVYRSVAEAPYTGKKSFKYDWEIIKASDPHTNAFDGAGVKAGDMIDLREIGNLTFGLNVTVHNKGAHSQVLVDVNLDKVPDMEIIIYDTAKVDASDYTREDFLLSHE